MFYTSKHLLQRSFVQTLNSFKYKKVLVELTQGDISQEKTDAIVNAANNNLSHGDGIAR